MPTIERVGIKFVRLPYFLGTGWEGVTVTDVQVVLVELEDSDGCIGTGFTYGYRGGESVVSMVEHGLADLLLGEPLAEWQRVMRTMWEATHRVGRGVVSPAISALDIAIWDLRSTRAEQPLYGFLGGKVGSLQVYKSGWIADPQASKESAVDSAQELLEVGYTGLKIRVAEATLERDVELLHELRTSLPSHVSLMVDANESLDLATAQHLVGVLAELKVAWLEEPIPSEHKNGYQLLNGVSRVPIAAGEHYQGLFEFYDAMVSKQLTVLQPDVALMGGVSEFLRVATISEAAGVSLAPHSLAEIHVHLALVSPNCRWVESYSLLDNLQEAPLSPADPVPTGIGHGIRWDQERISKYATYEADTRKEE